MVDPNGDRLQGRRQTFKAKQLLRPLMLASELGMTMGFITAGMVAAGLALGLWADRMLGTRPLATIVCLVLGALAGLLGMIDLAQSTARQLDRRTTRPIRLWAAFSARDLGHALRLVLFVFSVTIGFLGGGLGLGIWLSRLLGWSPMFTIVLLSLGVLGTLLMAVVFYVRRVQRRSIGDQ